MITNTVLYCFTGGFGGFGVTQPSAAPGFGTSAPNFGTSNQSSSTTPAFGTGQQSSATPAFGLTQPKPATSFGTSQTGSVPTFGAVNAQPNSGPPVFGSAQPTTTFGASAVFGSENSSEQKPPTGGSTASGGLFQFGATNVSQNETSYKCEQELLYPRKAGILWIMHGHRPQRFSCVQPTSHISFGISFKFCKWLAVVEIWPPRYFGSPGVKIMPWRVKNVKHFDYCLCSSCRAQFL